LITDACQLLYVIVDCSGMDCAQTSEAGVEMTVDIDDVLCGEEAVSSSMSDTPTSDAFYFESDHVALKNNEDYRHLLRAFVMLESQRTAALRDLDVLLSMQHKALLDPLQFVSDVNSGQLQYPRSRTGRPAELPTIDWDCYTDDVEGVLASLGRVGHSTRLKQKRELMSDICDWRGTSTATGSTPPDSRFVSLRTLETVH